MDIKVSLGCKVVKVNITRAIATKFVLVKCMRGPEDTR